MSMYSSTKSSGPFNISQIIIRLIALAVIDAFALWFIYLLVGEGGTSLFLAVIVGIVTIGLNIIFLRDDLYHLRWFSPGLALMMLIVLYPVSITMYSAFTNYGTGNLVTKDVAIKQIEKEQFLPEGGAAFKWTAFRSPEGNFALWLQREGQDPILVAPGKVLDMGIVGPLDDEGIPESVEGYARLTRIDIVRFISDLDDIEFGESPNTVKIRNLDEAAQFQQRYIYDKSRDILVDQQTGEELTPIEGVFTAPDGRELRPGFYVVTGLSNFQRLFSSPAFRGPFVRIFIWTFIFSSVSVVLTFGLGLFLAIVFNDPTLHGRKIIRSLLLLPYALPSFISVMMWRGLLNPEFGVISGFIASIFGSAPSWFADPNWAKIGILLIQMWLGFPYMLLITTGAIQSIPQDIYEAAEVDGASAWQQFRSITLPLLLVAVGPLLIGSFAFNFNNFTVIDVFNEGGPPIPGTPTPAGHTDILMTYIFRLAFSGGRGVDYGYASAITIIIFIILAILVGLQFRYTRVWEEVSENV